MTRHTKHASILLCVLLTAIAAPARAAFHINATIVRESGETDPTYDDGSSNPNEPDPGPDPDNQNED